MYGFVWLANDACVLVLLNWFLRWEAQASIVHVISTLKIFPTDKVGSQYGLQYPRQVPFFSSHVLPVVGPGSQWKMKECKHMHYSATVHHKPIARPGCSCQPWCNWQKPGSRQQGVLHDPFVSHAGVGKDCKHVAVTAGWQPWSWGKAMELC